jgi:hypothetical protein
MEYRGKPNGKHRIQDYPASLCGNLGIPTHIDPEPRSTPTRKKHGPSGKPTDRYPELALDNNVDAITQAGTAARTVRITRRAQKAKASSPPLPESFTTLQRSNTTPESSRNARRRLRTRARAPRSASSDTSSYGTFGNRGAGIDDDEGKVDQTISVSTILPGHSMNAEGELKMLPPLPVIGKGSGSGSGAARRLRGASESGPREDEGQVMGHDFRMIDRRVVEDGPERTVTISTWREDIARRPSDTMSVYYVNPDDYAAGDQELWEREERESRGGDRSSESSESRFIRGKRALGQGRPLLKVSGISMLTIALIGYIWTVRDEGCRAEMQHGPLLMGLSCCANQVHMKAILLCQKASASYILPHPFDERTTLFPAIKWHHRMATTVSVCLSRDERTKVEPPHARQHRATGSHVLPTFIPPTQIVLTASAIHQQLSR